MKVKATIFLLVSLFLVFLIAQGSGEKADLKKIAENYAKVANSADAEALGKLYTEDAVMIMSGEPEPIKGRRAIVKSQAAFYRAMPDFKVEFTSILFSGNHIIFEGISRGTHTGPLSIPGGEIPPTGKKVVLKFVFIARVNADGLIEEDRTYYDTGEMMKQLGLAN